MKKLLLLVVAVGMTSLSANAGNLGAGALFYTNGTIVASEQWGPDAGSDDFEIHFDINAVGNAVTYTYTLHVPGKELSHWILQLCPTLTADDLDITGATKVEVKNYGPHPSNPNFPVGGDFYGIKFDDGYSTGDLVFSIVTDRLPVDGNFYAKDGKNGGNDFYAYNTGLDPAVQNGAFIKVPGCEQIPEPTGFVLTAAGLTLFAIIRRKRS